MFALYCLANFPIDFQDGVNGLDFHVHESIFFSFECRMTQMNAPLKVLLNVD